MFKTRLEVSYQPPKISSQVSVRVDLACKKKADGIRRLWEAIARERGDLKTDDKDNPETTVEMAHVWRQLLERVVDEELSQLTNGRGIPPTEDVKAWADLEKSVVASYLADRKSKK